MKTIAICFVALFAVAYARSVIDNRNQTEKFDDRIFGGQRTTIEQHPHQISLRIGSTNLHKCGGSILSSSRALSAAHCIDNTSVAAVYSILAGSTTRTGDINAQVRTLFRYVIHERFNSPILFSNDVAILFWEEPLTFGANVRPIRLPSANASVPYGQNATATGWGHFRDRGEPLAYKLQVLTMPLVSNEECNRAYPGKVTPDMVCAGGEAGRGGCIGDSGGPLVHNNTLIGVTSWTRHCAHEGYPTVWARVAFFIDWIDQNIN